MANETPKLTFKYVDGNSWPQDTENGTLYFKLISNDDNNIYGNKNSFEMVLVLEGSEYFLTPKLATGNINGLLSSNDKIKIDSIPVDKGLITQENIGIEIKDFMTIEDVENLFGNIEDKNVVFTITKSDDEQPITGEGTLKINKENNNKIELKFSVPFDKIKGSDGVNGTDGKSPEILNDVNLNWGNVTEASASFEKDESTGKYKLNLNFPNLKGDTGAKGEPCSINNVQVTMINENGNASGRVVSSNNSENSYDIELSIPRGKTGPRGYPGAPGATGGIESLNIESKGDGNTVQDIKYIKDNGENNFILSTHNSPVLPDEISSKQYSILYKYNDSSEDLTYATLEPPENSTDVMLLHYNKENNSSKLGYANKSDLGIPKIELRQNNENDYYYIELHNVFNDNNIIIQNN